MVQHTVVQGDRCPENTTQDKDVEVQFDYITGPRAAQYADVSPIEDSLYKTYCTDFLKIFYMFNC